MQIKNIWNTLIEPSKVIVDVDQQRLARMFAITLLTAIPLMIIIGIFGMTLAHREKYLWQGDTFWPTIFALTFSLIAYLLMRRGKYYTAVIIYMIIFLFMPFLVIVFHAELHNVPFAALAICSVLLASIFLPNRLAIIITAFVATLVPLPLLLLIPDLKFEDIVAVLTANTTLSLVILVFSDFRDLLEDYRKKDQARLDYVIETSLNEIFIFAKDTLHFEYANESALKNLGYTLTTLKNMTPVDIKLEFDDQSFQDLLVGLLNAEQEKLVFETIHQRKDGSSYNVEVHLQLMEYAGEQTFVAFINDTTKRKQAEADLSITNEELKKNADHLQTALQERDQVAEERTLLINDLETKNAELERFTYTVSHDLKSPLITIGGYLGYLEQDAKNGNMEALQKDMTHIRKATTQMQNLLDEVLELSRVGRVVNPPKAVPFKEIVQDALGLVQQQLDDAAMQIDVAENLPIVQGDPVRLIEVIQNLVVNAVKFTRDQTHPRIEIGYNEHPDEQLFYVRDNGMGIDARYHEKVFGLFEKLNPASNGTGVGLALVKRIIEFHQGRVWIESDGETGTTFYFTLPKGEAINE